MLENEAIIIRYGKACIKIKIPSPEPWLMPFVPPPLLGSFRVDDGNGSENVSFKMNFRYFNLCRVYSNLLKMANVGEFPWSWFLEDRTQF